MELPQNTRGIDTYVYLNTLSVEDRTGMALGILAGQKDRPMVHHDPATSALRVLGDQEDVVKFIPQFAQVLRHPEMRTRLTAVLQLGRTYSPRAVPYLLQALKDESSTVRNEATQILERFETYRNQVQRFRELTTTEWPEPVKPEVGKPKKPAKEQPRKKDR